MPPNLRLSFSERKGDVLVQYDEVIEGESKRKRRAYFVYANAARVKARKKPQFVDPGRYEHLQPVLVYFEPLEKVLTPAQPSLCAKVHSNAPAFTLRETNSTVGYFELPMYLNGSAWIKKALLTPLAVALDLTVVGGVVYLFTMAQTQVEPY